MLRLLYVYYSDGGSGMNFTQVAYMLGCLDAWMAVLCLSELHSSCITPLRILDLSIASKLLLLTFKSRPFNCRVMCSSWNDIKTDEEMLGIHSTQLK